jgi:hypothetical protein
MVALVNDSDFEFLSQWKWQACCGHGYFYAIRSVRVNGKKRGVLMHRLIAGAVAGQEVDHQDHCTLNNQRYNLRLCTKTQNLGNQLLRKKSISGFKGVYRHTNGKWAAKIRVNGKGKYLGLFEIPALAAARYDQAAIETFGEFALTNKALGLLN